MKILPVGTELFHMEGRTYRQTGTHDETNSCFLNFMNTPKMLFFIKIFWVTGPNKRKLHKLVWFFQSSQFLWWVATVSNCPRYQKNIPTLLPTVPNIIQIDPTAGRLLVGENTCNVNYIIQFPNANSYSRNWGVSVGTATTLRAGQSARENRFFSFPKRPYQLWDRPSLLCSWYRRPFTQRQSIQGMKLTTHLYLAPKLRMC
jgi:hypothetical protein